MKKERRKKTVIDGEIANEESIETEKTWWIFRTQSNTNTQSGWCVAAAGTATGCTQSSFFVGGAIFLFSHFLLTNVRNATASHCKRAYDISIHR